MDKSKKKGGKKKNQKKNNNQSPISEKQINEKSSPLTQNDNAQIKSQQNLHYMPKVPVLQQSQKDYKSQNVAASSKEKSSNNHQNFTLKQFQNRCSLLDDLDNNSQINQSIYKGIYNLGWIYISFYIFSKSTINFYEINSLFNLNLFDNFKTDFFLVMSFWIFYYLYSFKQQLFKFLINQSLNFLNLLTFQVVKKFLDHPPINNNIKISSTNKNFIDLYICNNLFLQFVSAFFIQKLILKGLPASVASFIQTFFMLLLFAISTIVIRYKNWCLTHRFYILLHNCVFGMKMYAYYQANRRLRAQYLQQQKSKGGKSSNKDKNAYPNNITIGNFNYFLWAPTLIYRTTYPRKQNIRISFILINMVKGLILITFLYQLAADEISPNFNLAVEKNITFVKALGKFCIVIIIFGYGFFFITFELILNIFGEITKFGDRLFYLDYWNATTFDEYNRKWNIPVHDFLYENVYIYCLQELKTSRKFANVATFIFSAIFHEYIALILFEKLRPVIFGFMMLQLPLIKFGQPLKGMIIGNLIYQLGMVFGSTLVFVCYLYFVYGIPLY